MSESLTSNESGDVARLRALARSLDQLAMDAMDPSGSVSWNAEAAMYLRDYATLLERPQEATGLRHSGSCLTDPFAKEVCDGMYAEVVDQCLTLQEALTAVYSLAGENQEVADICRKAIIETGGEWDGHDSDLRRKPVEPLEDAERFQWLVSNARRIDFNGVSLSKMDQLRARIDLDRQPVTKLGAEAK